MGAAVECGGDEVQLETDEADYAADGRPWQKLASTMFLFSLSLFTRKRTCSWKKIQSLAK